MTVRFEDFDAACRAVAGYLGRPARVQEVTCKSDPAPVDLAPGADAPDGVDGLLEALLATLRAKEQEAALHRRRAAEVSALVLRDSLTGLANRTAWDRAIAREERRCRRYGGEAAVIIVDLDDDRFGRRTTLCDSAVLALGRSFSVLFGNQRNALRCLVGRLSDLAPVHQPTSVNGSI